MSDWSRVKASTDCEDWTARDAPATSPRGANASGEASYDDAPRWPPTPPDDGRGPQDGPFTGETLTVMASSEESPAHCLPFSAAELVGTLARLEARIARLEKILDEHGIYA